MRDRDDCDDGTQAWSLSRERYGTFTRSTGDEPLEDDEPPPEYYGTADVFHDREKCACCDISAHSLTSMLWHIGRLHRAHQALLAEVAALKSELGQ